MRHEIAKVIQERDSFRADLGDMYKSKKQVERQYDYDKKTSKDRETKLQKQLGTVNKENSDYQDEVLNLQKTVKQLNLEKEKSKLRI